MPKNLSKTQKTQKRKKLPQKKHVKRNKRSLGKKSLHKGFQFKKSSSSHTVKDPTNGWGYLSKILHVPIDSQNTDHSANKPPFLGVVVCKPYIMLESAVFSRRKKYWNIQKNCLKKYPKLKEKQVVVGYTLRSKVVITKILGNPDEDLGIFASMVQQLHQIPDHFSKAIKIPVNLKDDSTSKDPHEHRKDLTHLPFVTIDGQDAKDFDDAVYATPTLNASGEKVSGSYDIYVSIADVTSYVNPLQYNNPLNQDALRRGNSTYFTNSVLPMLPEALSNDSCSLNPYEKKATLTVHIRIQESQLPQLIDIQQTWIKSVARFTYEDVENYLLQNKNISVQTPNTQWHKQLQYILQKEGLQFFHTDPSNDVSPNDDPSNDDPSNDVPTNGVPSNDVQKMNVNHDSLQSKQQQLQQTIPDLFHAYNILKTIRKNRQTLELDIPDYNILYNKKRLMGIYLRKRLVAHQIIEEFMVTTNQLVAQYIQNHPYAIFRFHDQPAQDSIYKNFLEGLLQYPLPHAIKRNDLTKAIKKAKALGLKSLVDYFILRMQSAAVYTQNLKEKQSHFALGLDTYTHFTSPIRRYSDLWVHKIVTSLITKEKLPSVSPQYMMSMSQYLNFTERRSMIAEKTEQEYLIAYLLSKYIGVKLDAQIVSMVSSGLFLQPKLPINFFLPMESLPRKYSTIDLKNQIILGKDKNLTLGDTLSVFIQKVSVISRNVQVTL